ncbi:LytR C-terminal domain-containing protein [Agrococcus beijingensis]|uniref:LytR C-terminal domain-containing protein n=1 Tax=Agrococcus beijingensis TaxID=3068634 RepID=UPI0027419E62|nr:LytR C-terminal domain-containing protein [Agrococcus sp. REN33]
MSPTRRVGAHRSVTRQRMPRWVILLCALGAVVLLTVAGLFLLDRLRPQAQTPSPAAQEVITDPSLVDPALDATITVLDQSGEPGLAAGVGQAAADAGWRVIATGDATGGDAATTIVWYDSEALAPVARGLAQGLGVGEARLSDGRLSGTPITIVLGADAVGVAPSVAPDPDGGLESATPEAPAP